MKVILRQREHGLLRSLRKLLEEHYQIPPDGVTYTMDPEDVIKAIVNMESALVISSNFKEDGLRLARRVKDLNPNVFFVIYSFAPDLNDYVDAIVYKSDDPSEWKTKFPLANVIRAALATRSRQELAAVAREQFTVFNRSNECM